MRQTRTFTAAELAALWQHWKGGASAAEISRDLDRHVGSVYQVIRRQGGYPPRRRRRAARALRGDEREEISRGLAAQQSIRQIARNLGRCASTISREVGRNGGRQAYRAALADRRAWNKAQRPQVCLLAHRPRLRRWVERKLCEDWSPRQIAVGLQRTFPADESMRVSHETIYHSLFVQARGVLKQQLVSHLRRGRLMRHARTAQRVGCDGIVDGISIRERPAEVEDRAVPGHWEGDLLMGGNSSQVATLVERRSRYVLLVKVDSKDTFTVTQALARRIRYLPTELRRSLTWDRGTEMSAHKDFAMATNVQVYFCDPRSPWQRGSNENTNGLLRQYFPKGTDISHYSQAQLNQIARRLNERPRETLNWLTPLEVLNTTVATTA